MRDSLAAIGSRLTYANVMATIAVFCAIGGGTFAFAALKKNSVGTKQIAKNAVKEAEIAKNAVTENKIEAGAVTEQKLGDIEITGNELVNGSVGTGKLADGSVTTEKIADDAVNGAKVNESSLGVVPNAAAANTANTATTATTATRANKANNVLSVSVNSNGSVLAEGQPTQVVKSTVVDGTYTLSFGRDLSGCSAVASIGNVDQSVFIPNDATAGASIGLNGASSNVTVATRDLSGAEEDNNFHLVVVCRG
jgi:hypothetical protein